MLKVCFITPNMLPVPNVLGGAIEGLVTNMLKEQEKFQKIDMTVVSVYNNKAFEESKKYPNTKFIYINKKSIKYLFWGVTYYIARKIFKRNISTYNKIVLDTIKNNDYDYIIAEGGHYESYNKFLKYFPKDKLILHLHHQGSSNEIIDATFSKLIGVSKFVTDDFKKSTKTIAVTHLNNGIDLSNFDKEVSDKEISKIRKKYKIKDDDFVVIYFGRLVPVKGVLELIKAIKMIDNKKVKLMILGSSNFSDGKESEYTKKLLEEINGYEDRIFFTGYINNNEVYKYIKSADITSLPSLWEDAAPLACIEATICKKVVLATRSGGAPEYLQSDSSLIVEKDENVVNNLKNGIEELYAKRDKLKNMGEKAYKNAKKNNSTNYYKDFIKILNNYSKEDSKNE